MHADFYKYNAFRLLNLRYLCPSPIHPGLHINPYPSIKTSPPANRVPQLTKTQRSRLNNRKRVHRLALKGPPVSERWYSRRVDRKYLPSPGGLTFCHAVINQCVASWWSMVKGLAIGCYWPVILLLHVWLWWLIVSRLGGNGSNSI